MPYLAGWVDLDWLLVAAPSEPVATNSTLASGLGPLRELVAAAADLARWRGTARGLLRFLDTATGVPGFAIEENVSGDERRPRPFHLRIVAPAEAAVYRPLIERVIVAEKPAYATYELVFATGVRPGPGVREKGRFAMSGQQTATGPSTASDPSKALLERLLGWLPAWLGFALIALAGVAAIVVGIMQSSPGLVAFGVAAIISAGIAWWAGGRGEPRVNPFDKSFGAVISRLDGWQWLVIFGLFVIALIITVVT